MRQPGDELVFTSTEFMHIDTAVPPKHSNKTFLSECDAHSVSVSEWACLTPTTVCALRGNCGIYKNRLKTELFAWSTVAGCLNLLAICLKLWIQIFKLYFYVKQPIKRVINNTSILQYLISFFQFSFVMKLKYNRHMTVKYSIYNFIQSCNKVLLGLFQFQSDVRFNTKCTFLLKYKCRIWHHS